MVARIAQGVLLSLMLLVFPAQAAAPHDWASLRNAAGASLDYPRDVFSADAGRGDPAGQVLASADGAARLHLFTVRNDRGESPRAFLDRVFPRNRARLSYDRVARNFFAVSQPSMGRRILYRRCNFVGPSIHCADLQYPLAARRAFDPIVTRVSLSLRPR
jgi:hypothetical protein